MSHSELFKRIIVLTQLISLVFWPFLTLAKTSDDPKIFQTAYEQTGLYRAWDYATGSKQVVVAIIDNGFDTFHPDLFGNIWRNSKEIENNGIDDDQNGYVDDIYGWNFLDNTNDPRPNVSGLSEYQKGEGVFSHATVVAGIVGAVGNNGQDGAGVNWKVRLMNLKVLGNEGSGRLHPLGEAVRYAVDNGADVINISMVGDYDGDLDFALRYAFDKGVVVVAAMGNYGGDLNKSPLYPVCDDADSWTPRVLGVSATNPDRKLAGFSNTGSDCVDIAAPGVDIGSTVRYSPTDGLTASYGTGWQGTSFAAPLVAGTAALVKSVRPDWKAVQINEAILKTVHHTPADDEAAYAELYGKGMLQAHRAVAYAMGLPLPPTMFESGTYVPPIITSPETPVINKPTHAKTFVAVGASGQMRDAYNDSFELGGAYARPEAKNIESAAAYGTGSEQIIVTAAVGANKVRVISVYNNKWQLQSTWNSDFLVPVQVAIGQKNDGSIVIALAPTQSSTVIFKQYDTTGILLTEIKQAIAHKGVRLAVVGENTTAVFTTGTTTMLKTYGPDQAVLHEFTVAGLGNNPFVAIGDVIGDTNPDIVVGSGPGVSDLVRVYTVDGSEQRSFAPFGDGRKNGVSVIVVDADNNGSQDLLTYSANTSGPIRAWTAKAKNAGEWAAPFTGSFFLLPR